MRISKAESQRPMQVALSLLWCLAALLSARPGHAAGSFDYDPMNTTRAAAAPGFATGYPTVRAAAWDPDETSTLRRRWQGVGPVATLASPCSCRAWTPGSEGNATTLDNGQFVDTIVVLADAGQSWIVADAAGMYDAASPHPPQLPIPLPAGTPLPETSPGRYTLPVVHIDALGYTATLTNGTDTLYIANTCTYPEPAITGLDEAYCADAIGTPLLADNGGASGTGVFDILADDANTVLQAGATFFDPAALGVGAYFVRYTFDEADSGPCTFCAPGCVQAVIEPVHVVDPPAQVVCNDALQVSLDTTCTSIIHPDFLLEGDYPDYAIYEVHVYDNGTDIDMGNVVDKTAIGRTLAAQVVNTCNGNDCWTTLTIEDKLPPTIYCPADTLRVACTADLQALPVPAATDNCYAIEPILTSETLTHLGCADTVLQRLVRTWTAADSAGNQAAPCTQVVELRRPDLDQVVFPASTTIAFYPDKPCTSPDTSPETTGYPTLDGLPIAADNHCSLMLSWSDEMIAGCGAGYAIVRTWTVMDWCGAGGGALRTATQLISVQDQTPPAIECPDTLTVNAYNEDCTGNALLPPVPVFDNCGPAVVQVQTPVGLLPQNGGLVPGLALGDHAVTWMATDDCGNQSACTTILHVVDGTAPVAVCDEQTVVSLGPDGTGTLFAAELDDGSYDHCTEVTFAARRMDQPDAPFAETVTFTCDDMPQPAQVVVQVSDQFGNTNQCMVLVTAQDKVAPTIACPPDITIGCDANAEDLFVTGFPTIGDNCNAFAAIHFENLQHTVNGCGEGLIMRQFTVVDGAGLLSTCMQTITVQDSDPFTADDITWPLHYETHDCVSAASLHPDSLPAGYDRPTWPVQACGLIAFNYEDQFFQIAAPACFKIVRTWTVLDWCAYDGAGNGIWQYQQEIKVFDGIAPQITCPKDTVVALGDDCTATFTLAEAEADDCSPSISLSANSTLGSGTGPFSGVPAGDYTVTWTAMDGCGNSSSCVQLIRVRDLKKPSPVCVNGLIVELSDTAMQVTTPAADFNLYSSDNCTPDDALLFSFSENTADSLRTWDCDSLGARLVTIWVTDEAGNQDYCATWIEVQDNMQVCPNALMAQVAGTLAMPDGMPVADAMVYLNGYMSDFTTTDAAGAFAFEGLPMGEDYTLRPVYDGPADQGVSTYDLVLLTRHILNVQPLDGPWQRIAADVNGSGTLTTFDAVKLRRIILGLDSDFGSVPSWRFIPADHVFADPLAPWDFPEVASINDLPAHWQADFVAVKMGDLNGSAMLEGTSASDRSDEPVSLTFRPLPSGKNRWALVLPPDRDAWGLQAGWHLPKGTMEWQGRLLTEADSYQPDAHTLLVAAAFGESRKGEVLLELTAEADALPVLRDDPPAELIWQDEAGRLRRSPLAVRIEPPAATDWTLAASPNPFETTTTLQFRLEQTDRVRCRVYDLQGKLLFEATRTLPAGHTTWPLPASAFPERGMYLVELQPETSGMPRQISVIRL